MQSFTRFMAFVALMWSGLAAAKYILVSLSVTKVLSRFDAQMLAYFLEMPFWAKVAWAVGVWSGLLGAIFWMLDNRAAVMWLALSMFGYIVLGVYFLALRGAESLAAFGFGYMVLMVAVLAVPVFFYILARECKKSGHLG